MTLPIDNAVNDFPDDWLATCAIYGMDEEQSRSQTAHDNKYALTCEAPDISLFRRNIAIVQRVVGSDKMKDSNDPYFGFYIISAQQSPRLRVKFHYNCTTPNRELESATLRCVDFPEAQWPGATTTHCSYTKWLEWLDAKVSRIILETGMSFEVYDFLEHRALDFFRSSSPDEGDAYNDVVLCLEYTVDAKLLQERNIIRVRAVDENARDRITRNLIDKLPDLENQARAFISNHWKQWTSTVCPICFDDLTFDAAFEIPCGHIFCLECISTYTRMIVKDLNGRIRDPFVCPMPKCDRLIPATGYIDKLVSQGEMDTINDWKYDLEFPPCTMLQVCPRSCQARGTIRYTGDRSGSSSVFCDGCEKQWCVMCLKKFSTCSSKNDCDDRDVRKLCAQYRRASEENRARADTKWPWLKIYSVARTDDKLASKWVSENASQCPTCRVGIERTEGCFHMQCSNCSTHFCYECGDEIFRPYYGNHHCWLDRVDDLGV